MRRRSGGLHCETQEQFIQLAQLSQEKCGLYYDDQLYLKKTQIINKKNNLNCKSANQPKKSQKANAFFDFDYNEEQIQKKQEKSQINRQSEHYTQRNIIIICSSPQNYRNQLQKILKQQNPHKNLSENNYTQKQRLRLLQRTIEQQLQQQNNIDFIEQDQRMMDLYIHKHLDLKKQKFNIVKFWFMRINQIQPEICATYLDFASRLYRMRRINDLTDLEQHSHHNGKRHAITEAQDFFQILEQIMPHE